MFKRLLLLLCLFAWAGLAWAQQNLEARVVDTVNVRVGPGADYVNFTQIPVRSVVYVEYRNQVGDWMLVHTADGVRGWVASRFVNWDAEFALADLPISAETFSAPAASAPAEAASTNNTDSAAPLSMAAPSNFDASLYPPILVNTPIIPTVTDTMRAIYQRGQANGNNPYRFIRMGDCNTGSRAYMGYIAWNKYNLGSFQQLQSTIDYFANPAVGDLNSFDIEPIAAATGYTLDIVTDPVFSNYSLCTGAALAYCEFDRHRPAFAILNFVSNDSRISSIDDYRNKLTALVQDAVNRGTLPILTTFPTHPELSDSDRLVIDKNVVVLEVANALGIPVMNLWLATRALPGGGVNPGYNTLTYSQTVMLNFGGDQNSFGYTMFNLVTLQTLDALRRGLAG